MTEMQIYIPIKRKLYDDIVRFSDGKIDPISMAEFQLEAWVVRDLEGSHDDNWGERFKDAAAEYAPHLLDALEKDEQQVHSKRNADMKPLVWKEVSIRAGAEVRMAYDGDQHYAIVKEGRILDADGAYSPSEWASKIAGGTSRNAWRDLWFREPLSQTWVPAQLLRDQAREGFKAETKKLVADLDLDF